MKVFLDSDVVIYFVEQSPVWGVRAAARIAALRAAGESLLVSDLVRMECRVGPLRLNDTRILGDFTNFFADPALTIVPVTRPVCDRATEIRAAHGFKPMDSLHLAAAVENVCGLFLTHDAQLRRFPGITVEVLS